MPYIEGMTVYDADSHLMELDSWLVSYADPDLRERIRPLYLGGAGALADEAVRKAEQRRVDPAAAAGLEDRLLTAKGWDALGAFDPEERRRALDLLGFSSQLVFSTFAATQFAGDDLELLYGGARAHNRAMADFCAGDDRLVAVGFVPWGDAQAAAETVEQAVDGGCGAILVNSAPGRDRSPFHPDYDDFWARLGAGERQGEVEAAQPRHHPHGALLDAAAAQPKSGGFATWIASKKHIRHVRTRKKAAWTNAMIERFFGRAR